MDEIKSIKISECINKYQYNDFIDLIKIFINNPGINLTNAIFLKEQGFLTDEKIIIDFNNSDDKQTSDNSIIYMFLKDNEVLYFKFKRTKIENTEKNLDFINISSKFFKYFNIKVEVNNDYDDNMKDYVVIDNVLLLSPFISERKRIVSILKCFIEKLSENNNSAFDFKICKSFIDYYIDNKPLIFPDSLLKLKLPMTKFYVLEMNLDYFREMLNTFFEPVKLIDDYIKENI